MHDMSTRHKPEYEQRVLLEKLISNTGLEPFEQFRNFPVFTPRFNLARFLAHYEIFKQVVDIPGVIVDMGVFRGSSTFTWAKLCEIFCPTDVRKVVYGFDSFAGFSKLAPEDGAEDVKNDRKVGGYYGGPTIEADLTTAQQAMNADKHIRDINRIEFIKGDVCQTIPDFVSRKGQGLRIALLNLDLDLYEPTRVALENFVPLMTRGGIIIADEYAIDTFGGESKAIDEYFQRTYGKRPSFKKYLWHSNPSAYLVVDW